MSLGGAKACEKKPLDSETAMVTIYSKSNSLFRKSLLFEN
jgi:hypothetical protein